MIISPSTTAANSKVRVTVLVENTAQGTGVLAEHGLAYWVEWNGQRVLFDTGQGAVLASNAERLGIQLCDADAIVLSHGHYDHAGGLGEVLSNLRSTPVYLHPAALGLKYSRNAKGKAREIGVPFPSHRALRRRGHSIVKTEAPTTIFTGLTATGCVPRTTDFENAGNHFYVDSACSQPDGLCDDQSLFFETRDGIVVLLGCAHSGVINTLRYIGELSGGRPIHAVIGGMHMVDASSERIARTVDELRRLRVEVLAPAHCTGMSATAALWTTFPNNCVACHAGKSFEFDLA